MKPIRNQSIFWRLFASYLLIISVGCFTLYWAGDAFASFFADRHMGGMMTQMQGASPMMEVMATDSMPPIARQRIRPWFGGLASQPS
jgi:hypothetical protein